MPNATVIAAIIAITSPNSGSPVIDDKINSPPASMLHIDIAADKNMPNDNNLFLGVMFCLPATRKRQHSIDINTDDIATFSGDASPKNSAISFPLENPAPIAVPIYKNVVFNAFFTK